MYNICGRIRKVRMWIFQKIRFRISSTAKNCLPGGRSWAPAPRTWAWASSSARPGPPLECWGTRHVSSWHFTIPGDGGIDLCNILVTSQRFPRTHCWAPAFSLNCVNSLTGPVSQPFASCLGGQRFAPGDALKLRELEEELHQRRRNISRESPFTCLVYGIQAYSY